MLTLQGVINTQMCLVTNLSILKGVQEALNMFESTSTSCLVHSKTDRYILCSG